MAFVVEDKIDIVERQNARLKRVLVIKFQREISPIPTSVKF
nr:hypothetical protein [uncultured Campylobacter sp.]